MAESSSATSGNGLCGGRPLTNGGNGLGTGDLLAQSSPFGTELELAELEQCYGSFMDDVDVPHLLDELAATTLEREFGHLLDDVDVPHLLDDGAAGDDAGVQVERDVAMLEQQYGQLLEEPEAAALEVI